MKQIKTTLITLGLLATPFAAQASCGSASCPVNTQWDTQGIWTEPGFRADLRYEYIKQEQPRHGTDSIGVGEIPGHHNEVETENQNLVATLDYAFDSHWGIALNVPVVKRDHYHIHNHHGVPLDEKWDFTELGDVKLTGRYQRPMGAFSAVGMIAGFKLPTGQDDVDNADGDVAERSLQPGTGTTDFIFGPYLRYELPTGSLWAQAVVQTALNEHDEYEPGTQYSFDLGYRHPLTEKLSALAQLNLRHKSHDEGDEAEPESSGYRSVSISPGLSYAITDAAQLYGLVQLPLYQDVKGVQLTEDWSTVAGISFKF